MAEKPRNRPPARSHAQQTADRANAKTQRPVAPSLLSNLHKAGSPTMMKRIYESLMGFGGIYDWPSMNDILGREVPIATPLNVGPYTVGSPEAINANPQLQRELREYYMRKERENRGRY